MSNYKIIKMVENGLVIIVLFVIIIILASPIGKIVDSFKLASVKESTREIFRESRNFYMNLNIFEEVGLPLKIVFDENAANGYVLYSRDQVFNPVDNTVLKFNGKLPTEGFIEINENEEPSAIKLKFGKFLCSKVNTDAEVECSIDEE